MSSLSSTATHPPDRDSVQDVTHRQGAMLPVSQRLSIVTTTHLIPSAPSVYIFTRAIKSLRKRLNVQGCRHLVYYDAPAEDSDRHRKYQANLQALCDANGLDLFVRRRSGLKVNYLEGLQTISTPYMLFLEHDWIFKRNIPSDALLDVFDKYPWVHHVRFNKTDNEICTRWDHLIEPETEIAELPLIRTTCWSNNPHIVRVNKWKNDWLRVVGPEKAQGSFGLEEKLYLAYNREIFTTSFRSAHRNWGCFIYGKMTDRQLVRHINGSLSDSMLVEPFRKVGRRLKRIISRFGSGG